MIQGFPSDINLTIHPAAKLRLPDPNDRKRTLKFAYVAVMCVGEAIVGMMAVIPKEDGTLVYSEITAEAFGGYSLVDREGSLSLDGVVGYANNLRQIHTVARAAREAVEKSFSARLVEANEMRTQLGTAKLALRDSEVIATLDEYLATPFPARPCAGDWRQLREITVKVVNALLYMFNN